LLEEHSCQISSRSDLKRHFMKRSPQQEEEEEQVE